MFHRSHFDIHLGITGHNFSWDPQLLLISNLKPHIFTDWWFGTWFFSIQLGIIIPTDELIYFHRIFPGFSFPAVIRPWRDADVQALHRPATPSFPRRRQRHLGVALTWATASRGCCRSCEGHGWCRTRWCWRCRRRWWPRVTWKIWSLACQRDSLDYIYTHIYVWIYVSIYIYVYYKWANALVRRPPFKGGGRKAHVYIYIIIH